MPRSEVLYRMLALAEIVPIWCCQFAQEKLSTSAQVHILLSLPEPRKSLLSHSSFICSYLRSLACLLPYFFSTPSSNRMMGFL